MPNNYVLIVKKINEEIQFEAGNLVTFEFKNIAVSFSPRGLYNLLVKADSQALASITKASTADFISFGK